MATLKKIHKLKKPHQPADSSLQEPADNETNMEGAVEE